MTRKRTLTLALLGALALLALPWNSARAGVFIGVGIPAPYYGPYYRHRYYYYYGPRVVVVAPPVVVGVAPAPVYVTPAPGAVYVPQSPTVIQTAPPQPLPPPVPVNPGP